MRVIFETDMGNDVDDALAIDMLYKYADAGRVKLLAVMLDKEGVAQAEYVDVLNTWYGYPRLPIGIVRNGAKCNDLPNYAQAVCNMRDALGQPLFKRSRHDYASLPDAHVLYRELLAHQPDHSVTIIATGFSTNLARLLETGPDRFSPLTGRQLVERKVARLVMMAGDMSNPESAEFNVVKDIDAARVVFETWPTPLVTSPFEVGECIKYPGASIEKDFSWAAHHPVVEGYKAYQQMPYDRPTWDLTAVLYAVEGGQWFGLSPCGHITVSDKGGTTFHEDAQATRQYLTVTPQQAQAIRQYFVEVITKEPRAVRKSKKS